MLYVVIADQKEARQKKISEILATHSDTEHMVVDDSMMILSELAHFLYPSLFATAVPMVHAKFILADSDVDISFVQQLVASPTVFLCEEFSLPTALTTTLKKAGAVVHIGEKQKKQRDDDFFAVTACLTGKDKKTRWLAYRSAIEKQPIEAILGILYWKLRTLALQQQPGNRYEVLYREMLSAHAQAWKSGAPLELLIEKVILSV